MKTVLLFLLGAAFTCWTPAARAEQVLVAGPGSVDASGSVLGADGLWHYGGIGYVRTLVPGHWVRAGCCWRWQPAYYSYTAVAQPARAATLEDKVLAMAKVVNDTNEAIKARQEEVNRAIQLAEKFGLGPFPSHGRSPFPAMPPAAALAPPNVFLSSAGVNATTVYGYTLRGALEAYLADDDKLLLQALAQANVNTANIYDRSNAMLSDRQGQRDEGRRIVAETLARGAGGGELLRELKRLLDGPSSVTIQSKRAEFSPLPKEEPQRGDQLAIAATNMQCTTCHAGARKDGGFDVTQFRVLGPEQQRKVLERLTTDDPAKRMPRDLQDPKKPGPRAAPAQVQVFRDNMAKQAGK